MRFAPGGSGGQIDRTGNLVACNSLGAHQFEGTCPNDATYTPAAATGGYQAWGVGLHHVAFYDEEINCYLRAEVVFNSGTSTWDLDWTLICETFPVITPLGTNGKAMFRLMWGADYESAEPYANDPENPPAISKLAFAPNALTPCVPNITSECDNAVNSSYVEDAGYEVEVTFADPLCRAIPRRMHNWFDVRKNCFYYFPFTPKTDLPGWYRDTAFLDEPEEFNLGIGVAETENIVPGHMYEAEIGFRSEVLPFMIGVEAKHTGAITVDQCALGNVSLGPAEACHFGIDTASVGGAPDQFELIGE